MGMFRDLFGLDDEPKKEAPKPAPKPQVQAPPRLLARPTPAKDSPHPTQAPGQDPNVADVRGFDAFKRGLGMFAGGPPKRQAPAAAPAKPAPKPFTPPVDSVLSKNPVTGAAPVTTRTPDGKEKPPEVAANERMFALINEMNAQTQNARTKVKTDTDMFQMDQKKDLLGMVHDLDPKEWQLIQDNYTAGKPSTLQGELTNVPPLLARPGVTEAVPKVKAEEFSAAPLTWEAYEAMSADQKAAVDFNTMLVEAREKDLSKNWTLSEEEQVEYDKRVQNIFGNGGRSTKIAPNTVKLLETVDFQAVGQDLDQFLSLDSGFTMDELEDFKLGGADFKQLEESTVGTAETQAQGTQTMADYAEVRTPENVEAVNAALVAKTQTLATQMMEASQVLDSFRSGVVDPFFNPEKVATTTTPGASPYATPGETGNTLTIPGGEPMETWWLDRAYQHLLSPTADPNILFQEMQERGMTEGHAITLQNYISEQLQAQPPGVDSRSAQEIQQLLGIGG